MPTENIQWFPGHMAKTRKLIQENLKNVDAVLELLDARIPLSSRNPEILRLTSSKPRLILLNKSTLADPRASSDWIDYLNAPGVRCILTDCVTGEGLNRVVPSIKELLRDKIQKYESKGMKGRKLFVMVLGIPNVGKSSFINRIAGKGKATVEDRPGVTRDIQWYSTPSGVDFLDMPGVLWPKFENQEIGENLAITGAIKDESQDTEHLAVRLCEKLMKIAREPFCTRYKLSAVEGLEDMTGYEIFLEVGRKRGFLVSGGEIDTARTASILLDEFRSAKIGRITLDPVPLDRQPEATGKDVEP